MAMFTIAATLPAPPPCLHLYLCQYTATRFALSTRSMHLLWCRRMLSSPSIASFVWCAFVVPFPPFLLWSCPHAACMQAIDAYRCVHFAIALRQQQAKINRLIKSEMNYVGKQFILYIDAEVLPFWRGETSSPKPKSIKNVVLDEIEWIKMNFVYIYFVRAEHSPHCGRRNRLSADSQERFEPTRRLLLFLEMTQKTLQLHCAQGVLCNSQQTPIPIHLHIRRLRYPSSTTCSLFDCFSLFQRTKWPSQA